MTVAGKQERRRVLIVEDETGIAEDIQSALEPYAIDTQIADRAGQALELLTQWQPHMLVLDLMMPYGDAYDILNGVSDPYMRDTGLRLISEIRRRERENKIRPLEIAVITARADRVVLRRVWDSLRPNGLIFVKPFDILCLVAYACRLFGFGFNQDPEAVREFLDAIETPESLHGVWRD